MAKVPKRDDLIPPPWGKPLTEDDYAALEKSGISREIADAAMLRRVSDEEGRQIVGQKGKRNCAGILFSYYRPGEPSGFNHRIRRDNPDWTRGKDGKLKQDRKYLGPPNGANRLYIPPGVTPEQLADLKIQIVFVEGEKKALALWGLANDQRDDAPLFIPIAISGVWNFLGRIGKAGGPNGERVDVRGPIPDLDRVEWPGREVLIVFDTNVHTNDSVRAARGKLGRELAKRGAAVEFVTLPPDCGVNGIDDLIGAWGPDKVLKLLQDSKQGPRLDVVLPPQFDSRPHGMFRINSRGEHLVETQLTNFQGKILANIRLDDGLEENREVELEAELLSSLFRFTMSAAEFAGMNWPIERMGSGAIIFPGQKEYARTAIQTFSLTAETRCFYTHTGWRCIGATWVYLHRGGAITAAGATAEFTVRLNGSLSRYELGLPRDETALVAAVRSSLRLVDLGPPGVTFPLLAATCRSVLGDADFALHLAGETGAFKSELAALFQQHFGAEMNRVHLPAAWSSTGNALEALAFHAKDALLVIDDFAPQGTTADVSRLHAAADRVFRAAGNRAGRSRLDSGARLREPKPPRALVLSTGEDIPRGQSIRARLLILELSKGDIKPADLTICQQDAQRGLYAQALAAFLRSIAGRYEEVRAEFRRRVEAYRIKALGNEAHARTPEIVANLQAAFEMYLEFAVDVGAIDQASMAELAGRCWTALQHTVAAQAKHQGAGEPAMRFVEIARSLLASGRAHLADRDGAQPELCPESCGWRGGSPSGERIGWIDADDIYLEPTASNRAVRAAAREGGEELSVSEQTLKKRLHEKRLLASVDQPRGTLTVRRTICGSMKNVLHFSRATLLPQASDADEDMAAE